MTIKYLTPPPAEDGIYLVWENNVLTVAEYNGTTWMQFGIDYDIWNHSDYIYEIAVVKKLDLEELA